MFAFELDQHDRRADRLHARRDARELRQQLAAATRFVAAGRHLRRCTMTSADPDQAEADRGGVAIATDADDVAASGLPLSAASGSTTSRVFWKEFARAGPLPERHYEGPRTRHMQQFPEHGTLAAKVTVAAGRDARPCASSSPGAFPQGDIYWAYRNKPDGQIPDRPTPLWTQLLLDPVGRCRGQRRATPSPAGTTSTAQTLAFRDGVLRLDHAGRDQGRRHRDAGAAAHRDRHPPRGRRALGLGGPAPARRLLRGLLHPCLELPAGAVASVPRHRAHAARHRVGLQPAADWRPDLPPEAAARLRLRHHRPLRRRPFRRHHQDLPRLAHVGRHRVAAAATGRRSSARWTTPGARTIPTAGTPRRPASSPAASTRRSTWSCSARIRGSARCMSRRCSRMAEDGRRRWARPTSPTSASALGDAGADYINDKLFNGRWFVQEIDLGDKSVLERLRHRPQRRRARRQLHVGLLVRRAFGEIKYQFGEGCIADQILGQWHAEVAGLGAFLDPDRIASALKSVHAENFRADPGRPLQPLPQLRLRGRGRPADRHLSRGHPPAAWSPRPMPRRSGPASSTPRPRT